MKGSFILIGGRSGAGKTTLMRAAAERIDSLEILQTVTTRPRREGEADGYEYVFVTDEQYESLRRVSTAWDHLEYHGYKYGADAIAIREKLQKGISIICTVTPDADEIKMLEKAYETPAITVWIDVPEYVASQRISTDKLRSSRDEPTFKPAAFNYTFTPTGSLADDTAAFTAYVSGLLSLS